LSKRFKESLKINLIKYLKSFLTSLDFIRKTSVPDLVSVVANHLMIVEDFEECTQQIFKKIIRIF
jgi:hypothetical protein